MLAYLFGSNLPHKNIYLIFGCRKKEDILYRKDLEEWEGSYPEFRYVPVLSRETSETWSGNIGYVHPVYELLFADHRVAHFYICGWRNMVLESRERLLAMGYSKDHIHIEVYD